MMDTLEFFEALREKEWRNNIENETRLKIEEIIEKLQETKEDIISEVVENISEIEALKLEDKEEFTYSAFKKWMLHFISEAISEKVE